MSLSIDMLITCASSYHQDNCDANYGGPAEEVKDPNVYLPEYASHNTITHLIEPYYDVAQAAQKYNKPFIMFETNTGSCGGFPGISNSFVSALWGLDYGFQMAWGNFSNAMLHVGGQNVFYNVSLPPSLPSCF